MAIELPTYSAVFAFEKRLYAIYDFELPVSVSLFQGGVFLAALGLTIAVNTLFGVALSAATFVFWVVPPGTAAWLATQPIADGKRPHQWAATRLRHLGEPRTLAALRPERAPARWRPRGTATITTTEPSSSAIAEVSSSATEEPA